MGNHQQCSCDISPPSSIRCSCGPAPEFRSPLSSVACCEGGEVLSAAPASEPGGEVLSEPATVSGSYPRDSGETSAVSRDRVSAVVSVASNDISVSANLPVSELQKAVAPSGGSSMGRASMPTTERRRNTSTSGSWKESKGTKATLNGHLRTMAST